MAWRTLTPPPEGKVEPGPAPRFSLIVPAYQVAGTIGATLDSVFAQTYPAHEVIVCDDGSTDDLDGALAPYAGRITLIRKENGGVASAYNACIRAATGDFVVITDPDDLFHAQRLEALAELASARPDLDILTTDAFIEVDGVITARYYSEGTRFLVEDQRREMLRANFVFGLAALRRERVLEVGCFDESIASTSDWELFIRLFLSGSRAGLVDEALATYRLREGSITSSRLRFLRGRLATLEKTLCHPGLEPEERSIVEAGIADQHREIALEEARLALCEGRPEARRLARAVLMGRGQRPLSRLRAALAVVAPGLAGRRMRAKLERARRDPAKRRARRQ